MKDRQKTEGEWQRRKKEGKIKQHFGGRNISFNLTQPELRGQCDQMLVKK